MFNFAAFADQPQNASNENTQTSQETKDINPEEWTEWEHADYLPTGAGNYKLTCNVTLDSTWSVPGKNMKTAIDLNGYIISAQTVHFFKG